MTRFIGDGMSARCIGMEASELMLKLDRIRDSLISEKKGLRWRTRNIFGERVKWYQEIEQGVDEVYSICFLDDSRPRAQGLQTGFLLSGDIVDFHQS
jgi:hypothetical protein